MIEAMISGKLQGQPEQRTAKTGRTFVTARMRVAAGVEETQFVRVTAFSDTACTALLALGDGDALAAAGKLKVGVWAPPGGEPRPNLDMVAAQVLTVYHLERRRKAMPPGDDEAPRQRTAAPAARPARRQAPAQRGPGHQNEFEHADNEAWLAGRAP
jgi:single-stranded DNA-binding protein